MSTCVTVNIEGFSREFQIPEETNLSKIVDFFNSLKETEVEVDPTKRDLPLPGGLPELPPVPEGKTRWVYRGIFREHDYILATGRTVYFLYDSVAVRLNAEWMLTPVFCCDFHHIEAI